MSNIFREKKENKPKNKMEQVRNKRKKSIGISKRLYHIYGHQCHMPDDILELDHIMNYYPGKNASRKIVRIIRRLTVISPLNPRAKIYCRSQKMIYNDLIKQLKIQTFTIHPISIFRLWWEYIVVFSAIPILFFSPYNAALLIFPYLHFRIKLWSYIKVTAGIVLILDVLLNFCTGYYNTDGEICLSRKQIAKNYLRSYFIFDLLASIPNYMGSTSPYIGVDNPFFWASYATSFLKIFKCVTIMKYSKHVLETWSVSSVHMKLIAIFISILCIIHWTACIYLTHEGISIGLFGHSKPIDMGSWLARNNLWNSTKSLLYFTTLFRTTCIIFHAELTVHETNSDLVGICILRIVSKIIYTLYVCLLIQIARSITSSRTKYKEMIRQLLGYMHHKQISQYTQKRLIAFYEFRFQKCYFREKEIERNISGYIRMEILLLKCQKLIENVPMYKSFPTNVLLYIAKHLKHEIYMPGDVITKANTKGKSMYFIYSGTIAGYTASGKELMHIYDGDYFGEMIMILAKKTRLRTMVALSPCELYRLDRDDFLDALKPYPYLITQLEDIILHISIQTLSLERKHKYFVRERLKASRNFMLNSNDTD